MGSVSNDQTGNELNGFERRQGSKYTMYVNVAPNVTDSFTNSITSLNVTIGQTIQASGSWTNTSVLLSSYKLVVVSGNNL